VLEILLGVLVVEAATNKSLGGEESMLRVLYGLSINFKIGGEKGDERELSVVLTNAASSEQRKRASQWVGGALT